MIHNVCMLLFWWPWKKYLVVYTAWVLPYWFSSRHIWFSQSSAIIEVHLLPWLYITVYHLSWLHCLPLSLALSFLVCSTCIWTLPCFPSTISLGFSTVRGNKQLWFHQCESLSLIRCDPDGIFSSFYTSIHHLPKPQSHTGAAVCNITCQSEGRVSHKPAGHIIRHTFSF